MAPAVAGVVDVVEPMGAETYVYLKVAGESCIARTDSSVRCRVGDAVSFRLFMEKAHLFAEDGRAIV